MSHQHSTSLPRLDLKTIQYSTLKKQQQQKQSQLIQKPFNPNYSQTLTKQKTLQTQKTGSANLQQRQSMANTTTKKPVYTSSESLQNQYIYKNMQLDVGSLHQFIYDSSTAPLLNYKSKIKNKKQHDNFEDDQPFLQREQEKRTPLEILKQEENEKKRAQAAKDFVTAIFKKHFGQDAEKFQEKNLKEMDNLKNAYVKEQQNLDSPLLKIVKKHKKEPINKRFEYVDRALQERNQKLDQPQVQIMANSRQVQENQYKKQAKDLPQKNIHNKHHLEVQKQHSRLNSGDAVEEDESEMGNLTQQTPSKKKKKQPMTFEEREEMLFGITIRHNDIHLIYKEYKNQQKDMDDAIKKYVEKQNENKQFQINSKIKKYDNWVYRRKQNNLQTTDADYDVIRREFLDKNEMPQGEVFVCDSDQIVIWNDKTYGPTFVLYQILHFPHFHTIKRMSIVNQNLKDQSLFVLLEFVFKECVNMTSLDLSHNKAGLRTAQVIQKGIMNIPLVQLKMKLMDITTKSFCIMALGIAKSSTIEDINFSENLLDNRSIKTFETLVRYIKNIVKVDISLNQYISDEFKKNLKKIVYTSNQLSHKEIRIN